MSGAELEIDDARFIRDGRSLAFRRGSNWEIAPASMEWAQTCLPHRVAYPLFGGFSQRVSRFMRTELTGHYLKYWDGSSMTIRFEHEHDAVLFKLTFSEILSDDFNT